MECLVIMPFGEEFEPVFDCLSDAAEKLKTEPPVHCYWLKDNLSAGRITDDIVTGLGNSAFCIADLTGNNPNVMWETGYAMALRRPVILIAQSIASIPFDLHNYRLLEYSPQRLDTLQKKMQLAIEQTIATIRHSHLNPLPAHVYWLGHDLARAIRFAMHEDDNRVELEKCLVFAIHHLERIELPADDCKQYVYRALNRCREPQPFTPEDRRVVAGWIAQAKNDLGDAIAVHQPGFIPYPSAQDRKRIDTFAGEYRSS
jgi:hypothetical protein